MRNLAMVVAVSTVALAGPANVELPSGSADYRRTIRLVQDFKAKKQTFAQLTKAIVALKLKPHGLGCEYYFMSPPPPPPGITFEPKLMPSDWVGTFGEVAMTLLGDWGLERAQYDELHKAAHGKEPGFPNCGRGTSPRE